MFERFFEIFDWNLKGTIKLCYAKVNVVYLLSILLLIDLIFDGLFEVLTTKTAFLFKSLSQFFISSFYCPCICATISQCEFSPHFQK